jgi:molybdopterin-guanine dinucleotide biosynthesis protein A
MIKNTLPPASAVILAGGKSKRLGQDKALLRVEGQTLLARTVHTLAALSDDLVVVANHPDRYGTLALPVRLVPDERPGFGSLMGIYSGLRAARQPHVLVVACDMPFLNMDLLRFMLSLAHGQDVVVPRLGDFLEPLHAIYSRACLLPIAGQLEQKRRQIIGFFDQVRVRYVEEDEIDRFDPQHLSFMNVNTPQDWERVQRLSVHQRAKANWGASKETIS